MTELKCCPFCGGEAHVKMKCFHYSSYSWGDDWYVECGECGIIGSPCKTMIVRKNTGELVIESDGRADAIAKWNARAEVEE